VQEDGAESGRWVLSVLSLINRIYDCLRGVSCPRMSASQSVRQLSKQGGRKEMKAVVQEAEPEFRFVDPGRKEVHLANGPISIAGVGDLKIITFTQAAPRVDGISGGVSASSYDAIVVCRIAVTSEIAEQLTALIAAQNVFDTPALGSA
jgi:hypothetical protein